MTGATVSNPEMKSGDGERIVINTVAQSQL